MAGRLLASIAISALLSFTAWIAVQLNSILGGVLFLSAILIPPAVFSDYYGKRPRRIAVFLAVSLLLMIPMTPPPITGPNVEFGLHFATGCGKNTEGRLEDGGLTCSCNETVAYSTIGVSGIAWKSLRVELPIIGRFVTIYKPSQKVDNAYREAIERAESGGYLRLVGDYGICCHIIEDALFVRCDECVYLAKTWIPGGGLAVISARGPCRGVKGFALRWHDDYLWNVSEPPTFEEYRFNWSSKDGVRIGRLVLSDWPDEWVKNTYHSIGVEFKGTGYVKRMEGKSRSCRWSLWAREGKSYYVALKGKEILVVGGKMEDTERTAEKVSPCGLKNGRKVEGQTPKEVFNVVISELNGSFVLKQVQASIPWALAGGEFLTSLGGKNLTVTVLVYGIPEQCNYARYLLDTGENTTSICIERGGYFVAVAVRGDSEGVSTVLSSIKGPKRT